MANPADIKPSWSKVGTKVSLLGTIDASLAAPEWEFIDTTYKSVWPSPGKGLVHHGIHASGKAMNTAQDVTLGRNNPGLQISGPATPMSLAILLMSLLQDENYSVPDLAYKPQIFDDHTKNVANMFLQVESGLSGSLVWHMKGGVVSKIDLDFPAVDDELGKVTYSADIMGASSTRDTAFTSGSPALDTGTPLLSSAFSVKINGVAAKHVSMKVSLTNGAAKGMNAGATPDHMTLGPFGYSGELVLVHTGDNTDDWGDLFGFHEAKTATRLEIYNTGVFDLAFDALLQEPKISEQGNVFIWTIPFEQVYVNSSSLVLAIDSATDVYNWS